MKIIKPDLKLEYTCQVCGTTFISKKELKVYPGFYPLHSNKCVFLLYYNIISNLSDSYLISLAKLMNIKNIGELNRNQLIYEVTKKYPKESLSSINKEVIVGDIVT